MTAIVEVEGREPLMVQADNTVCWLSQYDDPVVHVHLLPDSLKGKDVELSTFIAYRHDTKADLVYVINHEVYGQVHKPYCKPCKTMMSHMNFSRRFPTIVKPTIDINVYIKWRQE